MKDYKMKLMFNFFLIFTIVFIITSCSFMNQTEYYYITQKYDRTTILDSSFNGENYSKKVTKDGKLTIVKEFNSEMCLMKQTSFSVYNDAPDDIKHGFYEEFDTSGVLTARINYIKGKIHGDLLTYYLNGKLRRKEEYNHGKLVSGICYDSAGNEIKHFPYLIEPSMDIETLKKCIEYPKELRKDNVEEDIFSRIYINKYGKLIAIRYDSNHSPQLINEIIRCLSNTSIESAKIDGEPMGCWATIPIKFRLK